MPYTYRLFLFTTASRQYQVLHSYLRLLVPAPSSGAKIVSISAVPVVVVVFARPDFVTSLPESSVGSDWYQRFIMLMLISGQVVGCGRSVAESTLTPSIYDFMSY
ncbi:hypothetical protein HanRHA438_Chr16g0781801 [Helianthus annuus]|nr:hypothetical protein HanRHA438_Chr16g0781801 [Helianthus annuus]